MRKIQECDQGSWRVSAEQPCAPSAELWQDNKPVVGPRRTLDLLLQSGLVKNEECQAFPCKRHFLLIKASDDIAFIALWFYVFICFLNRCPPLGDMGHLWVWFSHPDTGFLSFWGLPLTTVMQLLLLQLSLSGCSCPRESENVAVFLLDTYESESKTIQWLFFPILSVNETLCPTLYYQLAKYFSGNCIFYKNTDLWKKFWILYSFFIFFLNLFLLSL